MCGILTIKPLTIKQANSYVSAYHRHHGGVAGCKFAIGCYLDDALVGVAICGRPLSRFYDNGVTIEINRVCTDGTRNACSKLYGACCRISKEMGYEKIITYILKSENGASVKASGFTCDSEDAGGTAWTGVRKPKSNIYPSEKKKRYIKYL